MKTLKELIPIKQFFIHLSTFIRMKYNLFFIMLSIFLVSCKPCPHGIEETYFPVYMDKYFSVYKPGSYFIYLNQDASKKDSIFISSFSNNVITDKVHCIEIKDRHFDLNTEYLSSENLINITYRAEENGNGDAYFIGLSSDINWSVRGLKNIDSLIINNPPTGKIEQYQLWGDTGQVIEDVWVFNNVIFFAPDIGIAQFITNNNTDTFTITKVFIP